LLQDLAADQEFLQIAAGERARFGGGTGGADVESGDRGAVENARRWRARKDFVGERIHSDWPFPAMPAMP